jgi:hypothetical protein
MEFTRLPPKKYPKKGQIKHKQMGHVGIQETYFHLY